jgi:hypothetical protein
MPILHLVIKTIPPDVNCDAIGFEVSYHVRTRNSRYDYEGKEILVVVLDKPDTFGFFDSSRKSERQDVLNRSEIYLNGKDFGLQLGERYAISAEALGRPTSHTPSLLATSPAVAASVPSAPSDAVRLSTLHPDLPAGFHPPESARSAAAARLTGPDPGSGSGPASGPDSGNAKPGSAPALTQADVDQLQSRYQSQLDALAKAGAAQFHFLAYAPPSFALFRNQIVLQVTLRNTLHFEKSTSSIYKRAAQTFDLFLAPQLKGLLDKLPAGPLFDSLDVSVINDLGSRPTPASEAVEFICPLQALRLFVDAGVTNQELINQSIVLVNGVRIALNLAQVE